MRSRFGAAEDTEWLTPEWDHDADLGDFTARLLPAGHVPGSAMLHLTRKRDGVSLLYTGDFKLRDTLSFESCRPVPADHLILETTFGLPRFHFPDESETVARMLRIAREAIEEGEIPVLLGYSLGKAQSILTALADSGLPLMLHKAVHELTRCCEGLGMTFPPYTLFDAAKAGGHALVFPPGAVRSTALRRLKNTRLVMLSGWALTPGAKFRYQVDEVLPLSDHADHPDLLKMVDLVNPTQVWTVHGYAAEFATELRRHGRSAWSLISGNQLELDLELTQRPSTETGEPEIQPATPTSGDSLALLALTFDQVAASSSRLRKLDLLSDYLSQLDDENLELAALWLTGRVTGRRDQQRSIQLGWAVIRRALMKATGLGEAVYRDISRSQNDAGRTSHLMLAKRATPPSPRPWLLTDLQQLIEQLRDLAGPSPKTSALAEALATMDAACGSLLVRLLTGDLRIGLKEGLAEEAVARACQIPPEAVREGHMLLGHLGRVARLARSGKLDKIGAEPLQPVSPMLASPEPDAAAIWTRLTKNTPPPASADDPIPPCAWLEHKLDGIRAQLHRLDRSANLFSRDQRSIAREFPELLSAAQDLPSDVILDGEIIARSGSSTGGDFTALQHFLGRDRSAQPDLFRGPVRLTFVAFDLLWRDGESLLDRPLAERRRHLETLGLPGHDPDIDLRSTPLLATLPVRRVQSPAEIESSFHRARRAGDEGLIAKDPASSYRPGRRGKSWLKLKKPFSTLDVIVIKAQQGHGKRAHLLSDYTFAILDDTADTNDLTDQPALKVIGKAYSGLTDEELETLTEHFQRQTVARRGRVRSVIPDTVLEVAFDSVQPSKRHNSGLALRFPRIVAIRGDKRIEDIDHLSHARRLAGLE